MTPNNEESIFSSIQLFKGIPRLTKALLGFVVILYLTQLLVPGALYTLALTPTFILSSPFAFVQLFTAGFLENSIISLIVNAIPFLLMGKYLEPAWGTKEFLKFVILVNIATTISSYFLIIFAYMLSSDVDLLYHSYWFGFSGITAGLTVAIKQLEPESEVRFGFIPVRSKFVPTLWVIFVLCFMLVGYTLPSTPFVILGVFYSWFYLRFMQKRGVDIVGDLNDTFAFTSFFPDAFAPVIGKVADFSYFVFNTCGLWTFLSGKAHATHVKTVQTDSIDAERRRKRAARALEKKLGEENKVVPNSESRGLDASADTVAANV